MCEKGFGFEIDTEPPPSFCINTLLHTLYDERALICLQLWDAVEGSLRCSNDDGVSGITALAFLNNRLNTQKHTRAKQCFLWDGTNIWFLVPHSFLICFRFYLSVFWSIKLPCS